MARPKSRNGRPIRVYMMDQELKMIEELADRSGQPKEWVLTLVTRAAIRGMHESRVPITLPLRLKVTPDPAPL